MSLRYISLQILTKFEQGFDLHVLLFTMTYKHEYVTKKQYHEIQNNHFCSISLLPNYKQGSNRY